MLAKIEIEDFRKEKFYESKYDRKILQIYNKQKIDFKVR